MADKNIQNNRNNDNSVSDYQDLANLMVEHFEKVYAKLDQKADKTEVEKMINGVNDRIVRLSDKIGDYHAEQIGMQKQLNKHEKWHFKTAAKVGLDLLVK